MKSLDNIAKRSSEHLVGNEVFTYHGEETDMTVLEYWRWLYSELFDLQSSIAEYIVAKALGLEKASNVGDWTLLFHSSLFTFHSSLFTKPVREGFGK